jgi:hypothetical protein
MELLPQVVLATAAVVALPVALVWWFRAAGVVTSSWLCVLLAIAFSVVVSAAGSAYWKRCDGSERVVFSELLLWGWLRRLRVERQLAKVVQTLQSQAAAEERRAELLTALAAALDAQDPYTEGHSRRVARHSAMVARQLRLSDEEVKRVRTAAAMHDVGKLRVPPALLSKPDRLTEEEFEAVKRHATEGAEMVAGLGDDELTAIVRHHHERFDGTGYPDGLGGPDIPLGARIVAVADTFDAITSIRPYRSAAPHKQAIDHLLNASGTQLDPAVVRAFVRYYAGRKGSMLWAALAVVPQRLFAWMHGNSGSAGNVAFSEVAATVGSVVAVGVAAMGTAAAVGVSHAGLHRPSGALVAPRGAAAGTSAAGAGAATAPGASGQTGSSQTAAARGSSGGHNTLFYAALRRSGSATHSPGSRSGTASGSQSAGGAPAGGGKPSPQTARGGGQSGHHRGAGGGSGTDPKHKSGPGASSAPPGANPGPAPAPAPSPPAASAPAGSGTPAVTVNAPTAAPVNAAPASPGGGAGTPVSSPGPTTGPSGPPVVSSPPPPSPPSGPTNMDQCKHGGYMNYGFKNQGQCVASVMSH